MVELDTIEMGEVYTFTINQEGSEYEATIEMETGMSPSDGSALGRVIESNYPTGGWDSKYFTIESDGTVTQRRDPFGPIGTVVDFEKVD